MSILKEVLKNQVFPAMGCTEPVAVALAAATAAHELNEETEQIIVTLDRGTYKNGIGVLVPHTGGEKGNLIAAVMGAFIKEPGLKMEILKKATSPILNKAKQFIAQNKAKITVDDCKRGIYIKAEIIGKTNKAVCVIEQSHTKVSLLSLNEKVIIDSPCGEKKCAEFLSDLEALSLEQLVNIADNADKEDMAYIKEGIEVNLKAAQEGKKIKRVGYYLQDLIEKGFLVEDVFSNAKLLTAYASDARMDGANIPVMSSGESGNQGIIAILVPYSVGKSFKIKEETVLKSIALSHLLNSYVKVFTGKLSPICGCAIAAGVGAAAAIVYQHNGKDMHGIGLAVNNLISDLGGMLCDGAKSGCALKVVSSTDSAIRSAYMGIHHYGITKAEGFVGNTPEETIKNLALIGNTGMSMVDNTIVDIMLKK